MRVMLPKRLFSLPFATSAGFAEKRKFLRGCTALQLISALPGNDGRRFEARPRSRTKQKRTQPYLRFRPMFLQRGQQNIWNEVRQSGVPFVLCHLI